MELVVSGPGAIPARALPLAGQIRIGRGPGNHLVLPAREVSWHHAVIQRDGDRVWIRDLGSRNGTKLDGARIRTTTAWSLGAVARIGEVDLTLRLAEGEDAVPVPVLVEEVASGLRYPVDGPAFVIGNDPDADLAVDGVERVVLLVQPDGDLWLGRGEDLAPLAETEVFTVSGAALRVVRAGHGWLETAADVDIAPSYTVEVAFDAPSGPWARVTDTFSGSSHTISAPNRVSLLWYLADALQADRELPPEDRGWRSNESVSIAVWGRVRRGADPRLLKALIHNVRAELRGAGLDPWCLEKRRGSLRLRAAAVRLHPSG